jgi:hypothetical protein
VIDVHVSVDDVADRQAVRRRTAARNARPIRTEPPVSMTATQRLPTMKPMLAMSSWPGASSGNCAPRCTYTPGASSSTVSAPPSLAPQFGQQDRRGAVAERDDEREPAGQRRPFAGAGSCVAAVRGLEVLAVKCACVTESTASTVTGAGKALIGGDAQGRILAHEMPVSASSSARPPASMRMCEM